MAKLSDNPVGCHAGTRSMSAVAYTTCLARGHWPLRAPFEYLRVTCHHTFNGLSVMGRRSKQAGKGLCTMLSKAERPLRSPFEYLRVTPIFATGKNAVGYSTFTSNNELWLVTYSTLPAPKVTEVGRSGTLITFNCLPALS